MKSLHDKEINLEEPKDGFVLSLPTFGKNVSQIKNISSAHMDSMIHMCFLREKFSFDIWEKYMNHIFYDEFLAKMVWLELQKNEEQTDANTVTRLQNIYHTMYIRSAQTKVFREIERVIEKEGANRTVFLNILFDELKTRIKREPGELWERLYRRVERELVKEISFVNTSERTIGKTVEEVSGREIMTYVLHSIGEKLDKELSVNNRETVNNQKTVNSQNTVNNLITVNNQETVNNQKTVSNKTTVNRETMNRILENVKNEAYERYTTYEQVQNEYMTDAQVDSILTFNEEKITRVLNLVEEQVEKEFTRNDKKIITSEEMMSIIELVERSVVNNEDVKNYININTETTEQILHLVKEKTDSEFIENKKKTINRDSLTRILEHVEKEIVEKESVNDQIIRVQNDDEQILTHILHLIDEQTDIELAKNKKETINRETMTRVLDHVEKSVINEFSLTDYFSKEYISDIKYRKRSERELEVAETLLRENMVYNRELITQILKRVQEENVIENTYVDQTTFLSSTVDSRIREEKPIDRFREEISRENDTVRLINKDMENRMIINREIKNVSENMVSTNVELREAFRDIGEEISEIREGDLENEIKISEMKKDLEKAEEEIEQLKTTQTAEVDKQEEERRDDYHNEIVNSLFDNSVRLERMRHGV